MDDVFGDQEMGGAYHESLRFGTSSAHDQEATQGSFHVRGAAGCRWSKRTGQQDDNVLVWTVPRCNKPEASRRELILSYQVNGVQQVWSCLRARSEASGVKSAAHSCASWPSPQCETNLTTITTAPVMIGDCGGV